MANVLDGFATLGNCLQLEDIANPNVIPETIVETLLADLTCPEAVQQEGHDAIFRVALHSIV